jgi:hypothetical protein
MASMGAAGLGAWAAMHIGVRATRGIELASRQEHTDAQFEHLSSLIYRMSMHPDDNPRINAYDRATMAKIEASIGVVLEPLHQEILTDIDEALENDQGFADNFDFAQIGKIHAKIDLLKAQLAELPSQP